MPNDSKRPHPLLAGLTVGLLLFGFTLCTAALWFVPALSSELRIRGVAGPTWSPPTATPPVLVATPTPAQPADMTPLTTPSPTALVSGPQTFHVGDIAVNVNDGPVNLRKTPGYIDKPTSDRIGLVPAGDRVEIIGGPATADNLTWWQVRWQGKEGWMAERRASGRRLLAPAP
ncbi:MAG: SH3 domain-containing protein [Chloroflexi bacterium]|nr:SH3 domain-containing protein [Chloroflexota bacterium]